MALLDGSGGLFGGNAGNQETQKQWTLSGRTYGIDRWMDGDVTLTGNGFEQIGEVQVGADQKIEFGQGNRSLDPMEQGRPYHDYQDSNGDPVNGEVRMLHVSAQEGTVLKIEDYSTEQLREATKSEREVQPRASKPAQPNRGKRAAGQDDYLRIKINAEVSSSTTLSKSNSTISQPVTVHERN
jgi:hypothetical protein